MSPQREHSSWWLVAAGAVAVLLCQVALAIQGAL